MHCPGIVVFFVKGLLDIGLVVASGGGRVGSSTSLIDDLSKGDSKEKVRGQDDQIR